MIDQESDDPFGAVVQEVLELISDRFHGDSDSVGIVGGLVVGVIAAADKNPKKMLTRMTNMAMGVISGEVLKKH